MGMKHTPDPLIKETREERLKRQGFERLNDVAQKLARKHCVSESAMRKIMKHICDPDLMVRSRAMMIKATDASDHISKFFTEITGKARKNTATHKDISFGFRVTPEVWEKLDKELERAKPKAKRKSTPRGKRRPAPSHGPNDVEFEDNKNPVPMYLHVNDVCEMIERRLRVSAKSTKAVIVAEWEDLGSPHRGESICDYEKVEARIIELVEKQESN